MYSNLCLLTLGFVVEAYRIEELVADLRLIAFVASEAEHGAANPSNDRPLFFQFVSPGGPFQDHLCIRQFPRFFQENSTCQSLRHYFESDRKNHDHEERAVFKVVPAERKRRFLAVLHNEIRQDGDDRVANEAVFGALIPRQNSHN
jgi:hypothetical protein